ncbi:uncharacterized protein LOC110467128 [Mizuhopecten yessoensis]|uniref:Uncharacterized protein n=1 Tax=Mizuhopecten yessoensis TaxID=6573 RepID=A0A210R1Q4_MIZYE|nr:uncharacterized protein LOC110467128 [Mizuhopecten yessoensis]OWF54876.1 hypothetical protein KP79_PYT12495 [Mizuhopecten yessoensis]
MENASADVPGDLTLEHVCSDPAIREAFADSETSQIFKEIEEDPTKLKSYQENPKVQRSLRLIYDLLQEHLPCNRPSQQPLQLPGIMQSMTQLGQQPNSSMGPAELQGLLGMIAQSQANGGRDLLEQLIQQGSGGVLDGPASMNPFSAYQQPSSCLQAPTGHPPPNIPTLSGSPSSGKQMSKRRPPIALPMTGEEFQSTLPSKRRVSNKNLTPSEDQCISVLPPRNTSDS